MSLTNRRLIPPAVSGRVADAESDRTLRNHDERLRALELSPLCQARVFYGVELPNLQVVLVAHGLGRPAQAFLSWPYRTFGTSGRISMSVDLNPEPTLYVAITAAGWSGTITVDIIVV